MIIDEGLFSNPVTFLISYDEIIRNHNIFLLDKLKTELKNQIGKFIRLEELDNKSINQLQLLTTTRTEKNILKWLAKKEFDYDKNYDILYNHYKDMYSKSPLLKMGESIQTIGEEAFVENVFIYSKDYDKRKHFDIKILFKSNKVTYVTGNYLDVVEKIGKVDVFADNDLERIMPFFHHDKYKFSLFLLARYGYNYNLIKGNLLLKYDTYKLINKKSINLTEFDIIKFTPDSFRMG